MPAKFPYEERAARARVASKVLVTAAARRRLTTNGRWDRDDPSFAEWEARADEFWESMRTALPPGFWELVEQLKRGDPTGLDTIVDFLEADPMYFRSGYLKADLLRWLNRVPLNDKQIRRLRAAVLKVVAANWRREFHRYCLFAKRLDGPEFRADLQKLARSPRPDVKLRAKKVLEALDSKPATSRSLRFG